MELSGDRLTGDVGAGRLDRLEQELRSVVALGAVELWILVVHGLERCRECAGLVVGIVRDVRAGEDGAVRGRAGHLDELGVPPGGPPIIGTVIPNSRNCLAKSPFWTSSMPV